MMHSVVERQLSADDPAGVVAIAQELEQVGIPQHEIRHAIGNAIAGQLWYMSKEGCAFDKVRYLAELKEIVEACRHGRRYP